MEISTDELKELLDREYNRGFIAGKDSRIQIYNSPYVTTQDNGTTFVSSTIPEACRNCSNHPSNGGNGNCNCILGQQTITY